MDKSNDVFQTTGQSQPHFSQPTRMFVGQTLYTQLVAFTEKARATIEVTQKNIGGNLEAWQLIRVCSNVNENSSRRGWKNAWGTELWMRPEGSSGTQGHCEGLDSRGRSASRVNHVQELPSFTPGPPCAWPRLEWPPLLFRRFHSPLFLYWTLRASDLWMEKSPFATRWKLAAIFSIFGQRNRRVFCQHCDCPTRVFLARG